MSRTPDQIVDDALAAVERRTAEIVQEREAQRQAVDDALAKVNARTEEILRNR
ncbi:hypothetical protein [Streptomyces sp. ODS28]|uniref:hypothetical protein n=1 Tax=Streptomyces sp. ODS28 TaxID=3136688 RepID=UPI0031E84F9B